jgi:dolichol-phosphate mannosyltransferase
MAQLLSLVVPAYRQEKTITENIRILEEVLSQLPYNFEIIVVVDGMIDDTFKVAKKLKSNKIRVYGYEKNWGKGYAVTHGVSKARGDIIGFIDAGMDIDPSSIPIILDYMNFHKADIIVGSKLHPDSIVSNYPAYRAFISFGYRLINKVLFNLRVRDTQVGLKMFRKKVAKRVFSKITVKRFAFDVEVLTVATVLGYTKIYEAPVKLSFKSGSISSKNFWWTSFWTLWDTSAVFYRLRILKHYGRIR